MSHKHYDDTGHDIVHMFPQRGGGASHDTSINQPMAYVHGNPQYQVYQSFPLATNQGTVDYQFAPQVMVPIPIIVGQDQMPQVQKEDSRRNKRDSTELDYFLSRGGKHKERRYRSRSRSKSAGELSASPARDGQKRNYRSRSKSVGKMPSNPFRKDRSKVGSDDEDKRPKNPFRKRKSKSPSPRRRSDSYSRKSRQRSRSHERNLENRFRKRRHESRERSSKRYRKEDTTAKERPSRSRRDYRNTETIDWRKVEHNDRRKVEHIDRRHVEHFDRRNVEHIDSRNQQRIYSDERNEREITQSRQSPYAERVSRAGSRISRGSYNHRVGEWSPVSTSRSRYKENFDDDDDRESGQIDTLDDFIETNEQIDYDRHSVLSEQYQYERQSTQNRQNYSPLSDDTRLSDGVGLKIHVSNRGRWIENENKAIAGSSRKTKLMEDGMLIEAASEKFDRKPIRSYSKRSSSGRIRYIEDGVEVFYGDKSKTRRSLNSAVGMEDVSDSDSYDSQKDYKNVRTVRNVSQNQGVDFHVHHSGNMGPREAGYIDDNSFKQRRTVYHPTERLRVPNICIDYNLDKRTCANECRYLHLCKFSILDICNYGDKCKKNHDIFAFQSFNLLRKQNPNFERTQETRDKVKEILFSRFKRNKKNVTLPDNAVNVQRSPSVESIVSFETVESIASEESGESIDSFDARYYTADAANLKTKKKEKSSEEHAVEDSKKDPSIKNENDNVSVKSESKKNDDVSVKSESFKTDIGLVKSENKEKSDNDQVKADNEGDKTNDKPEKENESEKLLIKVEIENERSEKSSNAGDNKKISETNMSEENNKQEEKSKKSQSDKSKVNPGIEIGAKPSGEVENGESKCEVHINIEIEGISGKQNEMKNENVDKEESRSLSPVSVENIEDWDTLDRYERISEGGLSEGDKVEINIDDEDLESVSSNESDDEKDKTLGLGSDIGNNVAVPIGMNDPLVFNKSSGSDKKPESQSASLPNPNILVPPPHNIQPGIFPPVNFNVPPPLLPPRAPLMTPNTQLPIRPLFPIITSQNDPNQTQGTGFPLQQLNSGFPNQSPMAPNFRPTVPPPLIPPHGMFAPNMRMSNPPPLLPLNHLPTPDVMKEVIQTLSEKSESVKTELKNVTNTNKKATDSTKEKKKKEIKRVDPDLKEPLKSLWQFPHKAMINMSIIEFVTETEAYKDEMIAEIVKLLIKINLPYVTLKKLMSVIKENIQINIRTPGDMRKILEMYPDNFQIVETVDSDDSDDEGEVKKNVQIKSRVKLGFCSKHGYLPFYLGKCDCKQLHLCKFYFLSNCPNMNCKFGHKLKTEHNLNTFKHHRLHRMTGEEIMEYFRDVDSRTIETVPGVCRFYNSSKSREPGCYKGDVTDYQDICHNLHLCFFYVKGNCQVKDCQRSHNIRDKQPLSLLQKFGLDPDDIGEEKIMNLINLKTVDVKKKKEEKAEQFHNSRQVSPEEFKKTPEIQSKVETKVKPSNIENKTEKTSKKNDKPGVKFPSVCKFFNNPSGCKKKDWGAAGFCLFLHVCQKYVNGQCKIGEKCKRPHTFFSGEPAALITRYGIDLTRLSEQEILDTLNENDNALIELPMIGDDEDSEEEAIDNKTEKNRESTC